MKERTGDVANVENVSKSKTGDITDRKTDVMSMFLLGGCLYTYVLIYDRLCLASTLWAFGVLIRFHLDSADLQVRIRRGELKMVNEGLSPFPPFEKVKSYT